MTVYQLTIGPTTDDTAAMVALLTGAALLLVALAMAVQAMRQAARASL